MNRLITKTVEGNHRIFGFSNSQCQHICATRETCDSCPIKRVFDRLAEYEDTGMDPEEITAMMAENTELIERLADCESTDPDPENVFFSYVALYKAIHILQNGGILDEEEAQVCEHNLLFQIIEMMQANINIEGSGSK